MRIINVRVDDTLFKQMEKDKEKKNISSWDKYIEFLFTGAYPK
jgi:hypothetical protein